MWPRPIPGLQTHQGVLGWTQMNEYQEGVEQVEAVRAQFEDQIKTA